MRSQLMADFLRGDVIPLCDVLERVFTARLHVGIQLERMKTSIVVCREQPELARLTFVMIDKERRLVLCHQLADSLH
jgi:hypothetical protein